KFVRIEAGNEPSPRRILRSESNFFQQRPVETFPISVPSHKPCSRMFLMLRASVAQQEVHSLVLTELTRASIRLIQYCDNGFCYVLVGVVRIAAKSVYGASEVRPCKTGARGKKRTPGRRQFLVRV